MDDNPLDVEVDQIPGIGIIRARALKKAGWPTVGALRRASADDLTQVPGITAVKAAQILDYIQNLPLTSSNGSGDTVQPVSTPKKSRPAEVIEIAVVPVTSSEELVPVYAMQSPRDLMQDVAMSAQVLLTSEFSGKWERPFAAQLGKLITLHEKWERYEPLGRKQTKQLLELLQKIHRLLTETPVSEFTKRKSQDRLAEVLRDRRRKVRDILES